MSTKATRASAYQNGHSLAEAAFKFAPEPMQRAYRWADKRKRACGAAAILNQIPTLRDPSVPSETKDQITQALGIDWRKGASDSFCDRDGKRYHRVLNHRQTDPIEYLGRMRNKLMADLHAGKFRAFGFVEPRKPNNRPVEVPDDVMKAPPEINWDTSAFSGNGLKFVAVRIVATDLVPSKSRPGPRSRKAEIVSAYDILSKTIEPRDNRKTVCDKVRTHIKNATDKEFGLSDDVIWPLVKSRHEGRKS